MLLNVMCIFINMLEVRSAGIMPKCFLMLFLLFASVSASEIEADACGGMGCLTNNKHSCQLRIDEPAQKIDLQRSERSCDNLFQIRKKGTIISFCSSRLDSICTLKSLKKKAFVCENPNSKLQEWTFFKKADSFSQEILFDLALKGLFQVKTNGVFLDSVLYLKKYHLFCKHGGQTGEMIIGDESNWLLFRNTGTIWY